MKKNCKSSVRVARAFEPVIELLEQRQLLSASLTVSSALIVYNAVQNSSSSTTLTLTDTGDAPLTLGSGAFSIVNDPASATPDAARFAILNSVPNNDSIPATLSPGQSFGLKLNYSANAIGINSALLNISTNDPVNPTEQVVLRGIGTKGLGGSNQPSIATILRAYNIPTYVGDGPNDANAAIDATYPNPPDPSSQEVPLQRLVKAGTGPVTIQTLASFTASGFAKSYVLGTYTPGNPNSLNELFYTPSTENQTTFVHPQGSTIFDPGTSQFGFYFISNVQVKGRVGYSEDSLNTWDTTNSRKFRFFPLENADRSVVPNAYVMTSTEWNAPGGYDFTNIVAIVRNVKAAPGAPDGPVIGLINPNALPGSSRVIFDRIQSPNTTLGDQVHDTEVLSLRNTGDQPLVVSSYSLSTPAWVLVNPPTLPLTIAPGASQPLTLKFVASSEPSVPYNETNGKSYPTGGGVYTGTLTLNSNDPNNPTTAVALAGWWQLHSENENEPSLQTLSNLLAGWTTNINPQPISNLLENPATGSVPAYYGEEVVSGYWSAADPSQAIGVQQLDSYHTEGNAVVLNWYVQGSGSMNKLYTTATDVGQTLFPYLTGTTTPATANFTTTRNFGFRIDSEYTDDALNQYRSGGGHHVRFYPIRDSHGNLVANTYLMALDYGSVPNYDFQDNAYVVSNIRPMASPATPTDLYAVTSGATAVSMQWAPVQDMTLLGYNVYRASSATGPFALLNSSPTSATSYTDPSAPTGTTSYYRVTAVDSMNNLESLGNIASAEVPAVITVSTGHPVVTNQSVSTQAGVAITLDELATATDSGGTISASSVVVSTVPTHGTTSTDPTTGKITYMPAAGFSGSDTFQFTVGDSTHATSAPATITVTVIAQPIGDPSAPNLSATTAFQTPVIVDDVASATDPTGTLLPSTVTISQGPSNGVATIDPTTGIITYTPAAGFSGIDTLQYTIQDNLQAVSPPASITFTVIPHPTIPVAANLSSTTLANGSAIVNVVAMATAGTSALTAASVTITAVPAHGTATIDSTTGSITYTPANNFVGVDTLRYTVGDVSGAVSAPATLSFSVGVTVNNTTAKLLTFTDAGGNKITLALAGGGTAQILFNGTGTSEFVKGPHGTGSLLINGSGLNIRSISATGTTAVSSLNILHRGSSTITIGDISVAGSLAALVAPFADLTGDLAVTGIVRRLSIGSANGPTVTAQQIGTLTTTGNFNSGLTVSNSAATPFALGTVRIGGQIGNDQWIISGNTGSIVTGSVATGWVGTFARVLNSLMIRGGGFGASLTAGGINGLTVVGDDSGTITSGSIRSMRIEGRLNGGSLRLTNPVVSRTQDIAVLIVTAGTIDSQIQSVGNIGSIISAGITGSTIEAGTGTGVSLPATSGDFTAAATISSFQVIGRKSTFVNTDIAAQTIGSVNLGVVQTHNAGVAFGIGTGAISSLTATLDSGGVLHLNRAQAASSMTIDAYIKKHGLATHDLAIRVGL